MALDLYINYERTSNSSVFYRLTSTSLYTFNIKLSDQTIPNGDFSFYYVEYSVNNSVPTRWVPDENGFFIKQQQITVSHPCVSSVQVYISGADLFPVGSYQLSGVFVPRFPQINYIAYPSLFVNISNGDYKAITSVNYPLTSRGLFFYGEGHTEVVNLSSNNFTGSSDTMKWLVGNTISDIISAANLRTTCSVLSVQSSTSTATVRVTSDVGAYPIYPISLWATNSYITTAGPIITYRDTDGKFNYYPFFTSSLSADGITNVNTTTKASIKVLPYPERTDVVLTELPFLDSDFYLPFSYNSSTFTATTDVKNILGDALYEDFAGTKWELRGSSKSGNWYTQTPFLSSVFAYRFKLMYEKDTGSIGLIPFKASAIYPTSVMLGLTSFRNCIMSLPVQSGQTRPTDWKSKLVPVTNSLSALINPIPFNRIYTPNYYNIKDQEVKFSIINSPEPPYVIDELTLRSPNSPSTLVLTSQAPSGSMTFDVLGVVDLSATAILRNTITNTTVDASLVYQDMIEVLKNYDDQPNKNYFYTITTPLKLTYNTQPKLSPNEWATADNVNSIIEKIYVSIEELIGRSKVYNQKNKWYGYLEPAEKVSIAKIPDQYEWYDAPLVWIDLDCASGDITDETASWEAFASSTTELSSTWEWQNCGTRIKIDPSCFQKFCVQWNWKWRAKGASTVDITWKDTKTKNAFQKKWKWEKCTIDAVDINCERTKWNISTIEPELFPFPYYGFTDRCAIIDAEVSSLTDQMVLAHRTELHLIDRDYHCNHRARTGMADDLFSFQNIIGLATTNQGKAISLDSVLPRVSVYTIDKNNFTPFSNWGSYGLRDTPQGLNNPLDIHVDKYDSIWIADTGNACVKKFTLIGKPLLTITYDTFEEYPPISVCVDSQNYVHCLTLKNIQVFNSTGEFAYEYSFHEGMDGVVSKINTSYNKEIIYVTYQYGIAKYFRTGMFFGYILKDIVTKDGVYFEGYNSISQDKFRNVYTTAGDKILQVADLQQIVDLKANIPSDLYWSLEELLIHKEEYIQPWVYLKAFHRLWDNIELLRNSIFYVSGDGCKSFKSPTHDKTNLIIGQNEIVTNAVINRLSEQLWTNLQSIIDYFDPNCEN